MPHVVFMSVQIYVIDSSDRKRLEETGEVSREIVLLVGRGGGVHGMCV